MIQETRRLTALLGRYAPADFAAYERLGGLSALRRALAMTPVQVRSEVAASGLTGRGGAAFPTATKWEAAASQSAHPHYLIVNADEGEPGTAKDRVLLEGDPLAVLEGVIIAAYAIAAKEAYFYLRGEYEDAARLWQQVIAQAQSRGLLGDNVLGSGFSLRLQLVRGRGSYIAGEETAMIESLEMQRPMSRPKPPYPSQAGLLGKPTVVNNVETLAGVRWILAHSAVAYRSVGLPEEPGTRLFTLSGDVVRPGVYELPVGAATIRQLIDDLGGGISGGDGLKAVQPGGGSSALLSGAALDTPLCSSALRQAGSALGTAAVIVYSNRHNARNIAAQLLAFYLPESCGRCAPCRLGVRQMSALVQQCRRRGAAAGDLQRIATLGQTIRRTSLCGMGQSFPLPVLAALRQFPEDFAAPETPALPQDRPGVRP